MELDLITYDFLSQVDVKELAHICYFSDVSNDYVDHCADNGSFEFKYSAPVRPEFLSTLDNEDKEVFIDLILNNDNAIKKAYENLIDCDCDDIEYLEVA